MGNLVNTINDRKEETLPTQFVTIPDSPSYINRNQESWWLGDFNNDSIFSHQLELDQSQNFDELASFHLKKIELNCECEPDSQLCDLISVFEIYADSGVLTRFGPISQANTDSDTQRA